MQRMKENKKEENLEESLNKDLNCNLKLRGGFGIIDYLRDYLYKKTMWFVERRFDELSIEGKNNIPDGKYLVFAGNHAKLLDPAVFYHLIEKMPLIARDDFIDDLPLKGFPFKIKIKNMGWDLNSILNNFLSWVFDSIPIKRDGIKLSQTKRCIEKFSQNKKIGFFPMATRSVSGSIYDMYNSSNARNPGKLIDSLQRRVKELVSIMPFSLSYDELKGYGTLTIGKPFNFDIKSLSSGLPREEKEQVYDIIREKIMQGIGLLTKVYGDSILATIIINALSKIKEDKDYYLNKEKLKEIFSSVVMGINSKKEINLYEKLLDINNRENYVNIFLEWNKKKKQIKEIIPNITYRINPNKILQTPKKSSLFSKDVNMMYIYNKTKHINLLEKIVFNEINQNPGLISSDYRYQIQSKASKPLS